MKKPTVSQLKKRLDKLFSEYVRLRDSSGGWGVCITCDKNLPIASLHAGHFMSRRHSATRYDEQNVNSQCAGCNTFRGGEQYKYGLAVDLKYGRGTAQKLAAKAGSYHKFSVAELQELIADTQEQLSFLKN